MERPYVLLSAAMSADGYLDDASAARLVLSDAADLDRVDELRAGCDAILVGAQTIRADNPRLLVRSPARREGRRSRGLQESPLKVTLTVSGELDPAAAFFAETAARPLVYAPEAGRGAVSLAARLGSLAEVVAIPGSSAADLPWVLADLAGRGVGRLLVEGGAAVLGQFLRSGLADEFWLAVAPVFVADPAAPRLLAGPAPDVRLALAQTLQVGDMAVLKYLLPRKPAG